MNESLPRRPILGVAVAGYSPEGLIVGTVREGSMADAAGIEPGDIIVALEGRPLRNAAELRAALGSLDDHATIETKHARVVVSVQRRLTVEGTSYEHVTSGGVRLRTLVERPGDARGSVLFIQGIALTSMEDAAPVEAILRALPDVVTMRLEKRGVGDSEGEAPDFHEEVADFRAALATLTPPIVLVGHSVGGMIAPLLYDERVAGIVVIGTSSRRWLQCLDDSARRQAALAGVDEESAARQQLEQIAEDRDERSLAFHRQLDATDLRAAWERVRCPVLVLHGEYDWVVSEEESRAIPGRFVTLPGVDHAMTKHGSFASSRESFGRGDLEPRLGEVVAEFVRERIG